MERRLASGHRRRPQDQGRGGDAGRGPADGSVLGDVDALAARLAAIVEHADDTAQRREGQARGAPRRADRPQGGAGRRGRGAGRQRRRSGRPPATGCARSSTSGAPSPALDRKTDDALWKRYSAARETFNRRRGSHFAELDRERAGARQAKEALCERAEELSDSTDWGPTAAAFRDLLTEWKAAGRAAKDVDDALWQRFKAAQDTFFSARNAVTAERDAEFDANADAKEALLAEAERHRHLRPWTPRAPRCATIGDKWDAIGKVPRERGADLERRLRAVEKKVRDAAEAGGPTRRRRPAPTSSGLAPSSTSIRPRRPRPPAAPRRPKRPGPTPSSGGSGPTPRSAR